MDALWRCVVTLLDLAREIRAIHTERDEAQALASLARDQRARVEAKKATLEERIAAAETHLRHALACEYDGHAEHITAAMRALRGETAPVAPVETAEVDGFRVGDLVSKSTFKGYKPITGVGMTFVYVNGYTAQFGSFTRKPVEVGDTVRCVSGAFAGRTGTVEQDRVVCMYVVSSGGEGAFWTEPSKLVAVAP
jgi:hypothetical protein